MPFTARGRIGAKPGSPARTARYTYIAETGDRFFIWDGPHRAALFDTPEQALGAAASCNGPWFNMPDAQTVEAVEADTPIHTGW